MSAIDYFKQCPPIARTIAASTFLMSLGIHTGMLPSHYFVFYPPFFAQFPPFVWSLATCFFLTSRDLGVIFETYMIYTYIAKLERSSPKFSLPGDFFAYIVFVCTVSLGLCYFITGPGFYTSALIVATLYTSCQDDSGQMARLYIIDIPAEMMPYAIIMITWLMNGKTAAICGTCGLVAAHLHDFLTRLWPEFGGGRNLLPTPGFVRRLWETKTATVRQRGYGTSFAPAERKEQEGSNTGPLPDSWKTRGSGHRLG
ncbi:Der1-like family-domain-containing protein [Amylocarpus encephaloides]|uniref:Derlin n=1 Tax=Amylocarpus encephaloides TaxID=45428 RepID=A0A9P7YBT0_9HELO|nr:Der1-like family-domain-containing protein [Amylocarpus encephaloides]